MKEYSILILLTKKNVLMNISDESGLMETEVKEILTRLQKHSKDKFLKSSKFRAEGFANLKLKIVGNHNNKAPVSSTTKRFNLFIFFLQFVFFNRNHSLKILRFKLILSALALKTVSKKSWTWTVVTWNWSAMVKLSEKIPFYHRKTSKYIIWLNCIIASIYS